jgi:hypothetical protein
MQIGIILIDGYHIASYVNLLLRLYAIVADCEVGGGGGGGGGGSSSLVFSAIIRPNAMPTPSMTASKTAHPIALLRMAFAPPRTASAPPVMKPPMMAFQGSSFFLHRCKKPSSYLTSAVDHT